MLPRRAIRIVLIVLAMVGGLANFARCEPRTTLADGVQGNIEFKTLTLTSDQLLAGSTAGPDVLISGYLSFPKNRDRVPAIIISHGAGGISSTEAGWADELRSMGVATFLVDSFSGRGRTKFPREEVLSQRGQVLDLYRALALLTTHPRIDARRIALMGCSRGGGVAILAAESVRSPHFPPTADVAAYLAVYPTLPSDVDFSSWQLPARPIRLFQGLLDNVTPVDIARRFVAAQRAKGIDVRMFEYPNARHVFDNPALPPLVETRIGTIGYNGLAAAQAVKDNEEVADRNLWTEVRSSCLGVGCVEESASHVVKSAACVANSCHQSQDRQGARPDDSAVTPGASG